MNSFLKKHWDSIILVLIIVISAIFRITNLYYNSPFNDEAIYVVIGRMGVFQGDWWTYNSASWMAGQPYIYPSLSALAYMIGGIGGSRLLNILIGALTIEAIYWLTFLSHPDSDERSKTISGLISAFILAACSVGYYVSRLATYDAPSFYMFVVSLLFLVRSIQPGSNTGKWLFYSSTLLFVSFMTKIIIGIYIPGLLLFSFFYVRQNTLRGIYFWTRYYLLPIIIYSSIYFGFNLSHLYTYMQSQTVRGAADLMLILRTYFENTWVIWLMWIIASIKLMSSKYFPTWSVYTFSALIILGLHIFSHRWPTLDKHTFLSLIFLIPLVSIGLQRLLFTVTTSTFQPIGMAFAIVGIIFFTYYSYIDSHRFNRLWPDKTPVLNFLEHNIRPQDRVLAELGASAILAGYDQNYPPNTITFDWFKYGDREDKTAYVNALRDGYFNLVELDTGPDIAFSVHADLHDLVLKNLSGYSPIYADSNSVVYSYVTR